MIVKDFYKLFIREIFISEVSLRTTLVFFYFNVTSVTQGQNLTICDCVSFSYEQITFNV